VAQELFSHPEHLSSSPVFSAVRVVFCRSLFVLLSFFFWPLCCLSFGHCVVWILAIVLSGFLRFKDSDYPFGIYKHFLTRVVGRDSLTVLDQKNIVSDSS
jgi:hypothetical protein